MPFKFNLPVKTPNLIKRLYSSYIWDKTADSTTQKTLYLTFDDGPIPEVTPWVLDLLAEYNAQATFFCIGENITKNPGVFNLLTESNHSIGNHTYNHLNGWKTATESYISNFSKAEKVIHSQSLKKRKLFRPPYGKIKKNQARKILKKGYEVIMYDVIAYDWDSSIAQEQCLSNVIQNAKDGSIVVFHDSFKAERNMKFALPKVLAHFSKLGYDFKGL